MAGLLCFLRLPRLNCAFQVFLESVSNYLNNLLSSCIEDRTHERTHGHLLRSKLYEHSIGSRLLAGVTRLPALGVVRWPHADLC